MRWRKPRASSREAKTCPAPRAIGRPAFFSRYGVTVVEGDRYAGEWPRERFSEHGIRYEPARKTKSDLYLEALPLLNSRQIELLDLPPHGITVQDLWRIATTKSSAEARHAQDHLPDLDAGWLRRLRRAQ